MYFFLENEKATEILAQHLAKTVTAGMVISLDGNLGMGKTFLVRSLLYALGYTGKVKSPTYTLVESYPLSTTLTCYHFDCYRFNDPEEWEYAGFREYFNANSLCFIEWAEKLNTLAPPFDLVIQFYIPTQSLSSREVNLIAKSPLGYHCLTQLEEITQQK